MSNKKRKHKNATAGNDDDAAYQSQESSKRETLSDFAYFQEMWDKSIQPTSTAKKRKSNKQSNTMMDDDDDDIISTTSSLQSSHFSTSSDSSSIQRKKKRRKANTNKHDDTSTNNTKDIHNKNTKTSKCNPSKKMKGRRTHRKHPNSYQTLYHNMSISQVDELVGWAHSHSDDTNHNHNTIDNKGSEVERGIVDLTHSSTAAPPPPSHIAYLQHQISNRLKTGNSSITTEDTSDERRDRRSGDINISRDVDKSTYSTISKHNHNNNLDTSAYIAIGMAIEESLTRSLMPLAYKHVERCRRLELERDTSSVSGGIDLGSNSANTNESTQNPKRLVSDPFHAWTLKPAEAVAELAKDGYSTSNAVSELLGISQSKETSSKDSPSSESSTSSSSDDS